MTYSFLRNFASRGVVPNSAAKALETLAWWPLVEDRAHSHPVEPEAESIFLCKFGDLCFALRLV